MLSVIAESEGGYTAAESIRLNWAGDEAPVNDSTLFFLAIGVADYGTREELPDLPHCAESARALAEKIPGHVMTEQIETKLLINPTSEEAASGLSWLSQVEAEDVALVYVCGHAMRRPGPAIDSFQLFPADIQTLEAGTFRESLTKPRGEVVLMLDTAHLPHDPQVDIDPRIADVAGFANALSQPWRGVNLFAAAVGDQVAEVDLDSGLTVFAKALVDLLDEPSDGESDEAFTLIELVDILSARVATATQGRQTPQLARSSLTSDFPLVTPAASVVARAKSSDGGAVAEVLAGELPESPASTAGDESTTTENDSRD
jgi:hypothetical protein